MHPPRTCDPGRWKGTVRPPWPVRGPDAGAPHPEPPPSGLSGLPV